MKELLQELYPLRRDLVSNGFDKALNILSDQLPLEIVEVPSGTQCFDWIIPRKWEVDRAYVENSRGEKVVDTKDHPLHLASYSIPFEGKVERTKLLDHVTSYSDRPELIPFDQCYYEDDWKFCMTHNQLEELNDQEFYVQIDSSFEDGILKVGKLQVDGHSHETIVLVAHLCHPYQVNDGLSGVSVLVDVAQELLNREDLQYSYEFLFVPETIGSVAYLSESSKSVSDFKCGIFLEMLAHDNDLALQYSLEGDTEIDRIANYVLKHETDSFRTGQFGEIICNDEKVFNATGIDIPMISLSRANNWKDGPYYEYHSHRDDPSLIRKENLKEAKLVTLRLIDILESNFYPKQTFDGIPHLSRHDLWMEWQKEGEEKNKNLIQKILLKALYMLDGSNSVSEIANALSIDYDRLHDFLVKLKDEGLLKQAKKEENQE
jgi:aminopeptidase-like protein